MKRSERRRIKKFNDSRQKTLFEQLDKIYNTAVDVAEVWDLKTIPLTTLKVILKKYGSTQVIPDKNAANIITSFNSGLDAMYTDLSGIAKKMGVNKIPVSEIKRWNDTWKRVYIEARSKTETE